VKLATWTDADGSERFGPVVGDGVLDVSALDGSNGPLERVEDHLRDLPSSRDRLEQLLGGSAAEDLERHIRPLSSVRLLAPVPRPAAILDCGLTPRHLANSSAVLLRRSLPRPLGAVSGAIARRVLRRPMPGVRYYKGNRTSVSGPDDTVPWPPFSAYLDIEPELALVTGALPLGADRATATAAVAGYTIFNDVSARDVQLAEMLFTGPATSKDLDHGNGLGPWLVTPDELGDPRRLEVHVTVADRPVWRGSTAEYSMDPVDVLVALAERQSLPAGTVVGMGTVPDTCGLDRDEWLEPGTEFAITFEGIGTLRQRFGVPSTMPRTAWAAR
jgi:2-keto-4-pentenoate hydratase/2-oxohepta-3-ene-1,7-dioic acid hydratase in catechol pathway